MYRIIFLCLLFVSCSALSKSINQKDYAQIDKYLEEGYDVNQKDMFGYPLLVAARKGDIEIVKKLLDHGAKEEN